MLDVKRLRLQAFRWSIFTGSIIAVYWAIRWLTGHEVPIANAAFGIEFPFTISRWWDIAAGPLAVCLVCVICWKWDWIETTFGLNRTGPETLAGVIVIFVIVGTFFVGEVVAFLVASKSSTLLAVPVIFLAPVIAGITGYFSHWTLVFTWRAISWLWRWLTVTCDKRPKLKLDKAA